MWTIGGADRLRFPRFPSKLEKRGNACLRPHTHRPRQPGELIIDDSKNHTRPAERTNGSTSNHLTPKAPYKGDVIGEVRLDPAIGRDAEVAEHFRQQRRLAIGGKSGQFAFVAIDLPAKRLGHGTVGEAKAARGIGAAQPAIVAIEVASLPS